MFPIIYFSLGFLLFILPSVFLIYKIDNDIDVKIFSSFLISLVGLIWPFGIIPLVFVLLEYIKENSSKKTMNILETRRQELLNEIDGLTKNRNDLQNQQANIKLYRG